MSVPVSILNDVLGPVMRGPSSSHTAGSFHIGRLVADLAGGRVARARLTFDHDGSYGRVYREQGADRAFVAGLLGWPLTDQRFFDALALARPSGLAIDFAVGALANAVHPNDVGIEAVAHGGGPLSVRARSVGGGAVEVIAVNDWPIRVTGDHHVALVEVALGAVDAACALLGADGALAGPPDIVRLGERVMIVARRFEPLSRAAAEALGRAPGVSEVRGARPLAYVKRGRPLAESGAEMVSVAEDRRWSLGRVGLAYESALLGLDEPAVEEEVHRRYEIMRASVESGLSEPPPALQVLEPSAGAIARAERQGRLPGGGLHTRAAARALAVMHASGAMGVVCAAPTGGSAGVLPGVVVSLAEDRGAGREVIVRALLAASAIGAVIATRATFAAEVAGCQVEIGAAGAMAAAGVVEAAGGTARQATDAAAIALQNTMGSVCDLVQGIVEIPCHTRNAVAASSAFVCADLVLGGYRNPIPLDETIDAVAAVGRMMPAELRCTARGGLAVTPSALALRRRSST